MEWQVDTSTRDLDNSQREWGMFIKGPLKGLGQPLLVWLSGLSAGL